MEKLLQDFEAYIEKAQFQRPADMDRLLRHNSERGKNLAICVFFHGDSEAGGSVLYSYYSMAKRREGDLETLKKLTAEYLSFHAARFLNYYTMTDGHELLTRAAAAVPQIADFDQYIRFVNTIQHFFVELTFWVDICIPWAEASEAFTQIMAPRLEKIQ